MNEPAKKYFELTVGEIRGAFQEIGEGSLGILNWWRTFSKERSSGDDGDRL